MKCMCGSCWPTHPYIFNPTLNIKMVFVEKIPNMGTLSDFVTIFFVKCYNKFTGPRSPVGNVSSNTDVSLTADPGIASSIPARSNAFVEIDHEIISTVILLPSAESFKKGCCQLQVKVCARSTG